MGNESPGYGGKFCEDAEAGDPPVLNAFGLPILAGYYLKPSTPAWPFLAFAFYYEVESPAYEKITQVCDDCCSICAAWTACLQRIPLRLDLTGFEMAEWLDSLNFNICASTGGEGSSAVFADGGPTWLDGTYPVIPWHMFQSRPNRARWGDGTHVDLPVPCGDVDVTECDDFYLPHNLGSVSWNPYTGFGCGSALQADCGMCGSHRGVSYRKVDTPNGKAALQTEVWLDALARCEVGTGENAGEPVIVFRVFLFTVVEWEDDTIVGSLCREQICCEILRSNEIPVTPELTLADLVDIPLIPRTYLDYLEDLAEYQDLVDAYNDDPDPDKCFGYASPSFGCGPPKPTPCTYELRGEGEGAHLCKVDPDCLDGVRPVVPLNVPGDGERREDDSWDNKVSLILFDCVKRTDCSRCEELVNNVATKAQIDFTATGGCRKLFTAVVPECLAGGQYFWSFGATGETALHTVEISDSEGSVRSEEITLLYIDPRGCMYIKTKTVTCDCLCLDQAFQGLDVSSTSCFQTDGFGNYTPDPLCTPDLVVNCFQALSGTITPPSLAPLQCCFRFFNPDDGAFCPTSFIELCKISHVDCRTECPDCPSIEDNPCEEFEDPLGDQCCYPIGPLGTVDMCFLQGEDPDTHEEIVEYFRYRTWDEPCGCHSPWLYFAIANGQLFTGAMPGDL